MKKKLPWLVPPLLLLAFFLLFFSRSAAPRHVFLITLDTTRADAIDYQATGKSRTPNLAALASSGMRYANAYTVSPITLPSHAAMFYSLAPHVLKVYHNGQERDVPYPSLAEVMKQNGYATGAVISLAVLNRNFGLAKGFDHYLENFKPGLWYKTAAEVNRDAFSLIDKVKGSRSFIWIHYSDPHEPYFPPGAGERFTVSQGGNVLYSGPSIEQPVLRLPITLQPGENSIRLRTEIPAFLLESRGFTAVSFSDLQITAPDAPADIGVAFSPDLVRRSESHGRITFNSPRSESVLTVTNKGASPRRAELSFKYMLKVTDEAKKAGYEKEVRFMDSQVGLLLDFLKKEGLYEESTFLVMGDHGEGLGEYKSHYGHIHYLNKCYSHVPFFISGRNIPRGEVLGDLVSNFNVAPTLLSLAGIRKPKYMAGTDVFSAAAEPKLFLETYSPEAYFDAFSAIHFPWQVIFYPGRTENSLEFYNLERDRFGTIDLQSRADPSGQRSAMTNSVLKISRIITASKRRLDSLNQKTVETLKSLGYL